jgi:hypothetical protein
MAYHDCSLSHLFVARHVLHRISLHRRGMSTTRVISSVPSMGLWSSTELSSALSSTMAPICVAESKIESRAVIFMLKGF